MSTKAVELNFATGVIKTLNGFSITKKQTTEKDEVARKALTEQRAMPVR